MQKPLVFTAHARIRLRDRRIDPKWIEETIFAPDWVEAEPKNPVVERRFRAIAQFGGRVLRVASPRQIQAFAL
jgi:hypothetical protein